MTIGTYDGVHLGHRSVISQVCGLGRDRGLSSVLVTFDRHPLEVLRPQSAPNILCDLPQKLELLAGTGIERCAVVRFDTERAAEPAEDFVRRTLVECLGARLVVVGEDFRFGRHRRGDVALLEAMGRELGFEVRGIELAAQGGEVISSTRIRALLSGGEVAAAARLLGRLHEVRGEVVPGDGRGRRLGYPTANVELAAETALPADGIYAGWAVVEDTSFGAAISLGTRPTFHDAAERLLEAYLLDFDDSLYGQRIAIRFAKRLRPELRFETAGELVRQMDADVAAVREVLRSVPAEQR